MTNLRFKEYTFRNNPRRLVVLHRKRTASAICCGFGESLQQLGPGLSEVQGEGELFGEDAMEQFAQLRVLMEGGSGVLSGAGTPDQYFTLGNFLAVLESLQMTGSGGEAVIGYRFRFIEER